MSLRERWTAAAELVAHNRDVLDARPHDGVAPEALVQRGWEASLLALDDEQLAHLEVAGLEAAWPEDAPSSLVALARQARHVCDVAPLGSTPLGSTPLGSTPLGSTPLGSTPLGSTRGSTSRARAHETPRKAAQIDAFARLVLPLASTAKRIVDVGSGHGHLTREIAERIALPVVGLERNAGLAERARELAAGKPLLGVAGTPASFALTDVMRDGLPLMAGDCVIGLHACGELGDAIVESAARWRASVALVGCCLQKRSARTRRPLCTSEQLGDALDLPKDILGLSNLTARDEGVEATRAENLAGRERRLALHRLLSSHGTALRIGAEIEGLNRRAAQRDLATLVARAYRLRGRPAPDAKAIAEAAGWARVQHARARRLSIPRALLARVLEVFVLLDRALYLHERGYDVTIGTVFSNDVSARNLALSGSPHVRA